MNRIRFQLPQRPRCVVGLGLLLVFAISVQAQLEPATFQNPPPSARPMTWMHMMNDNVSQAGLVKDLQSLAEVGEGGALIFVIGRGIPDGEVKFNSPEFRDIIVSGAQEADRLGLKIGVHNCDGWSSSGGPWVKVEDSMKRVVWSETVVNGGTAVTATLPQPPTQLNFYRDIAIVAYPATATELALTDAKPVMTSSMKGFNPAPLQNGTLDDTVTLNVSAKTPAWLQLAYAQPFTARSLTIEHESRNGKAALLTSDDGVKFTKVCDLGKTRTGKATWVFTQPLPSVTARFFRIEFDSKIEVRQIDLSPTPLLPDWLGQSSLASTSDDQLPSFTRVAPEQFTPVNRVRVLTEKVGADGRLTTTLPPGGWCIMRFGYTTTAAFNHPATAAGRGLECDKFSRAALDKHFAAYVGKLAEECGPLAGKSFKFSEIDSYEMGGQNWTEGMAEFFQTENGYELTPFLPLLAGRCIGDAETATAVLRDFRALTCSLMVKNYYQRFTELCHEHGMESYVEPYGNGPINDLTAGGAADIPMGEFWMDLGKGSTFKSPVSAAHTYGKPVVSAESFTSWADLNWKLHPYLMKYAGDYAWTEGINQFMFHRFAHQANTHVAPGMTMGNVGSHIDRTQTWWLNAGKAWMQYLQRGSWLLRQGVPVSDVLVYVGEGSPHGVPRNLKPALPDGTHFDACDTEVLLHRVTVKDGRLVLPEGTSYRALALHNCAQMSLKMLRRIQALAEAGAIIVGPKPTAPIGYAELQTKRAEFTAMADALWGSGNATAHPVGQGKVYGESAWPAIFQEAGLAPDLTVADGGETAFIHRQAGATDIYFVLNKEEKPRTLRASFRVSDRVPELWHADTGLTESLGQFTQANGRTEVELALPAHGSAFVVFREAAKGIDPVVKAELDGKPLAAGSAEILNRGAKELTLQAARNGDYRLTLASGGIREIKVSDVPAPLAITGAWQVSFDEQWGGPKEITFATLTDWKDHALEGIRHYSGTAIYRKTVTVPADWLRGNKRILLNLGRVEIAAEVLVNGKPLGTLWKPPFVMDVTAALQPGENALEIRVTNPWTNRLIGDEALPQTDGYSLKGKMPGWYVKNEPPPASQRRTFTTFNFYDQDHALLPSGLLGPVTLSAEARVTVGK
jgi:hypothetical protein